MASIFKRGADLGKRRSPYYVEYFDERGKRRRRKGFTDIELTQQMAAKLEQEVMLRKRGMIDPQAEKLAKQRNAPIADHLAAFKEGMENRGVSAKHVKLTMGRIKLIIDGSGIESLAEMEAEQIELRLSELRTEEDWGNKTYNHYVQAIDSLGRWLVKAGRVAANPVASLARLNTETDVRHKRRALSPEELAKLVASARNSGKRIQAYSGEQRARLYLLSYLTGLRRRELGSLTPKSFDLNAKQPTVTVQAACSKHRRLDVLPLHPELVTMLPGWLADKKPTDKLFPNLERKKTWLMVKLDLERVDIEYETEEGIADFHASGRHSYVTGLLRHGATLVEARELARHTDVRTTMRYTHIGLHDQARALASLPSPQLKPAVPADQNGRSGDATSQQSSQHSGGPTRQAATTRGTTRQRRKKKPEASSTVQNGTYDASGHVPAEAGTASASSGGGGNRMRK